jgi:hypothetical protein
MMGLLLQCVFMATLILQSAVYRCMLYQKCNSNPMVDIEV